MKAATFLCVAVCVIAACAAKSYRGWKNIQIFTDNEEAVNKVLRHGVELIQEASRRRPAEIAVPPGALPRVIAHLKHNNLKYKIADQDIQSTIDKELKGNQQAKSRARRSTSGEPLDGILKRFPKLDEVHNWLKRIHKKFPQQTELFSLGKSYEKRDQNGIILGKGKNKPVIWIESAIHAREWATVPSSLTLIYRLLTRKDAKHLIKKYVWYVVPVVNVDGYVYTFTDDRMWRKNRRPLNGSDCVGVDLNRNFDFHWEGNRAIGWHCAPIYPGPKAFSEPESRNLANYMKALNGRVKFYMDIHAYGRMWLMPWGYDSNAHIPHQREMKKAAKAAAAEIRLATNHNYQTGTPGEILYNGHGTAMDYVRGVLNVTYSYAAELGPYMYDKAGFMIDVKELPGVVEEAWKGIIAAVRAMK